MSSTVVNLPETSPPPPGTTQAGNPDQQPKSSSLYLFTFLSTLFLLLLVSTAIVLRSFLLRRRYRMGLQEQLDDILRPPGDPPAASRKKHFGAKPELWDTWIKLNGDGKGLTNGLAELKPLAVKFVPQEPTKPKHLSSTSPALQSEQERRHERSSAFLAGLFTHPLPLPRHTPENDCSEADSTDPSAEISHAVQVSVVISMPTPNYRKPPMYNTAEEEFPNVAIGFAQLPLADG